MHQAIQHPAPSSSRGQGQEGGGAGQSDSQPTSGFYGFMAKVKFRSKIAEIYSKKSG